jgi:hypothetical protein
VQVSRILSLLVSSGHQECSCGHATAAHEHYRRGTDCALCACDRFHGVSAQPRDELEPRRERVRAA